MKINKNNLYRLIHFVFRQLKIGFQMILAFIKSIPRLINWIFTIVIFVFGLALLMTSFKEGLIFILVAIFISPYLMIRAPSSKLIIILLGIVITNISLYYETDEQRLLVGFLIQSLWLDPNNDEDLKSLSAYFEREKRKNRKMAYLAIRDKQLLQLELLYKNHFYEAVIKQGTPYITFAPQVREWVNNAKNKLKQKQIEIALKPVPQMMKAGQYAEVYQRLASLNSSKVQKQMLEAKMAFEKELDKLRLLYETGEYKKLIIKAKPHVKFDCRSTKLVVEAKKAMVLQEIAKLMKEHQYHNAIRFTRQCDYADQYEFQEVIQHAQNQLNKIEKKKILERLATLPSDLVEANLREYRQLVRLFPYEPKYQRKLDFYKKKQIKIISTLILNQEEYGNKWPFTVSKGELECQAPGIIKFKVHDKI